MVMFEPGSMRVDGATQTAWLVVPQYQQVFAESLPVQSA